MQRFGGWQQTPPQPSSLGQHDGFHGSAGMTRAPVPVHAPDDPIGLHLCPSSGLSGFTGLQQMFCVVPIGSQCEWSLRSQQTPLIPLSGCGISAVHGNFVPPAHVLMQR